MTISLEIRERYLRDGLATRLGGLAADLARIASFSKNPQSATVVSNLLNESRHFIEWTVPELLWEEERANEAHELVRLQRNLTSWYRSWPVVNGDDAERRKLAEQAGTWADLVLKMSGLLETE